MPKQTNNQFRIIAGQWRGRKIRFPTLEGLRPTPDRVRETLFNWLAPHIVGARCWDCFAGSGALGLEALSRGADYVLFTDKSSQATQEINAHLALLGCKEADVICTAVPDGGQAFPCLPNFAHLKQNTLDVQYLLNKEIPDPQAVPAPFDIVFIDPPYDSDLPTKTTEMLINSPILAPGALIYLEMGKYSAEWKNPSEWTILHDKRAGNVRYILAKSA